MRALRTLWRRITRWYEGTPQEPEITSTRTTAFFFLRENQRHWSARLVRVLWSFYLREWKWIWATLFALYGLFKALKKP